MYWFSLDHVSSPGGADDFEHVLRAHIGREDKVYHGGGGEEDYRLGERGPGLSWAHGEDKYKDKYKKRVMNCMEKINNPN